MNVILRSLLLDGIRADLLRYPARLAARHVGSADLVEQRRLSVIDVSEHGDDRRRAPSSFPACLLPARP